EVSPESPACLRRELAPDLAAVVRRGVDVDIAFAGLQVGKLRVGQRRRAGDRAGGVGRAERNRHPGIRAGRGAAMDVGGGSRTGQAGEFHSVCRLLRRRIDTDLRAAFAWALYRRDFGIAGEIGLVADRDRKSTRLN